MEQYIPKSALVAEIERMKDEYLKHCKDKSHAKWSCGTLDNILYFLNTLEVKEVDLNREMQAFAFLYLEPLKISDSNIGISITMAQLYRCAKHFYELGFKAQRGENI